MDEDDFRFGPFGESVPNVKAVDLKAAWEINASIESRYPGQTVGVAGTMLEDACNPGADIRAVGYRCVMLSLLESLQPGKLAPWKQNGRFDEAVFSVMAKIPMVWMGEGLFTSLPFDVNAFFSELKGELQ